MRDGPKYRLGIDAFSVESIPMARLAEYMAAFARLLGEQASVHFEGLAPGSVVLVSRVDPSAAPRVGERLRHLQEGRASKDAEDAYKTLDHLLAKDNAVGILTPPHGVDAMAFPGRSRPRPISYGPFRERGSLDGVVVRVGGRDKTIPVLLCNGGASYPCQASIELSKKLALHYLGPKLRVHGSGKWVREEDKTWTLQQFDIDDFEVLDDAPLEDVINHLHAVEGGAWDDLSLTDLLGLRREPEDRH